MKPLPSCEIVSRCEDSRGGVRNTNYFQTTNNAKENVFLPFHAKAFNIYTAETDIRGSTVQRIYNAEIPRQ